MMYDTTKDKLKRVEEQHQFEVQDKQKVELSLRNMELEMRTLASSMKQARSFYLPNTPTVYYGVVVFSARNGDVCYRLIS